MITNFLKPTFPVMSKNTWVWCRYWKKLEVVFLALVLKNNTTGCKKIMISFLKEFFQGVLPLWWISYNELPYPKFVISHFFFWKIFLPFLPSLTPPPPPRLFFSSCFSFFYKIRVIIYGFITCPMFSLLHTSHLSMF